jgi:hypothetical protein
MPPKRVSRSRAAEPTALPVQAPAPSLPAPISLPQPDGAWRILAFLLSLIEPTVGLLLALLYWRGIESPVRRFARWCLALAILGWLIQGGTDAVQSGLHRGDWYIQPY